MALEADPLLRRVERTALVVCAGFGGLAFVLGGGRLLPVAAVAAGGLLALISYRMIVASAGGLARAVMPADAGVPDAAGGDEAPGGPSSGVEAPGRRGSLAALAVGMAGRYALLALLAYVMIARLRLPPMGLLAGASSVVAAVALEAVRFLSAKRS